MLCSMTLVGTILAAAPASAFAAEEVPPIASKSLIAESLKNVAELDSSLLLDPAQGSTAQVGTVKIATGSVEVPADLSNGVKINSSKGESVSIGLPNAAKSGNATVLKSGAVAYPGQSSANSIVVGDLGVQMLTTITGAEAPTRYSYTVTLDAGQRLELRDGGAAVVNADGNAELTVAAAWAKDADGKNIPTHYEVDGSILTQVVEHSSVKDVAYPVVADPIWLAPWVVKCLIGIGLKGPEIARIASLGTITSILGAFGRGAVACIFGK